MRAFTSRDGLTKILQDCSMENVGSSVFRVYQVKISQPLLL